MNEHEDERDPTDWDSRRPVDRIEGTGRTGGNAIQFNWWNLLLLLPLLMLITAMFNTDEPRLLGLPFFYWFQFAFVFVGVASVAIVFVATNDRRNSAIRRPGLERGSDRSDEVGR